MSCPCERGQMAGGFFHDGRSGVANGRLRLPGQTPPVALSRHFQMPGFFATTGGDGKLQKPNMLLSSLAHRTQFSRAMHQQIGRGPNTSVSQSGRDDHEDHKGRTEEVATSDPVAVAIRIGISPTRAQPTVIRHRGEAQRQRNVNDRHKVGGSWGGGGGGFRSPDAPQID